MRFTGSLAFLPRWGVLFLGGLFLVSIQAAEDLEFELPRRDSNDTVRLSDFSGQILVLDFFAYWCVPCRTSSPVIDREIGDYYRERGGNRFGVPVVLAAVNIEADMPELTAEFMQAAGMELVLDDAGAGLLKRLGGSGIPYLVVIDGSGAGTAGGSFRVVYAQAGFEGVRPLRKVIDSVGGGESAAGLLDEPLGGTGVLLEQMVEMDTEFVWASDFLLSQSTLRYGQTLGGWQWDVSAAYNTYGFEYQPSDIDVLIDPASRVEEDLSEERVAVQGNLRRRLGDRLTLLGNGGVYHGFSDYRSIWLDNWYRQESLDPFYGFTPGDTYAEPEPGGYNFSGGLRWEYLPTAGFLQAEVSFLEDDIASSYTLIDPDFVTTFVPRRERGVGTLHTTSYHVSTENILHPRVRVLLDFQLTDTTQRELRYGYRGALNWAIGERVVLRSYGGFTEEDPGFEAYYLGATLEYELATSLHLSLSGRYYHDTGERDPSLPSFGAAPALESYQAGLGLRYEGERSAWRLTVGPYFTRYDAIGSATESFTHLYEGRDWGVAQLAYSYTF